MGVTWRSNRRSLSPGARAGGHRLLLSISLLVAFTDLGQAGPSQASGGEPPKNSPGAPQARVQQAQNDEAASETGAQSAPGSLFVPIFPGRRWEQRSAPLAGDPRQDQPVSATVLDKQTLSDTKIEDVVDLVKVVPGLSYSSLNGNGQTSNYTLRGISRFAPFTTTDYPVGLTVDGVPIANPAAYNFALFDVSRAEVLRGPQGTLGGRNAIAGLLNFETVAPLPKYGSTLISSYGNFDERSVRGSINSPLVDGKLYQRFSAAYRRRDGNLRNLAGGKPVNDRNDWGLRQQLRWLDRARLHGRSQRRLLRIPAHHQRLYRL